MNKEIYELSSKYIQGKSRQMLRGAAVTATMAICIAAFFAWRSDSGWVVLVIGLSTAPLLLMAHSRYKGSKEIYAELSSYKIAIDSESLSIANKDYATSHKLSNISKVLVSKRKEECAEIYLEFSDRYMICLEGIEKLDKILADISMAVGNEKVRYLRWWQPKPK